GASGYFTLNGARSGFERASVDLAPGDILEIVTPGAGGYGDPALRNATSRVRDLREKRFA
ncbi:hydantoinase B/oxoprolinase family protein, partial [Paracoccus versutus]